MKKNGYYRNPTSILIWADRITESEAAQTSASSVSPAPQKANKWLPLQACRGDHIACFLTLIICVLLLVLRGGGLQERGFRIRTWIQNQNDDFEILETALNQFMRIRIQISISKSKLYTIYHIYRIYVIKLIIISIHHIYTIYWSGTKYFFSRDRLFTAPGQSKECSRTEGFAWLHAPPWMKERALDMGFGERRATIVFFFDKINNKRMIRIW